jgi:osmoprotectant transport system permease protein
VNIVRALRWIGNSANYGGANGIDARIWQHVWISLMVLAMASVVAIPVGFAIGHVGRGEKFVVAFAGGVRSLPTLGVITLLALWFGIGLEAPVVALVILAIPSILAGAYSGFAAVDRQVIDAARAMGMTELQIIRRVETPLGFPLLVGGLRSASLQVVATLTLADYVGGGGLGRFIFLGLKANDYAQMLGGSILFVALAVASEALFAVVHRLTFSGVALERN